MPVPTHLNSVVSSVLLAGIGMSRSCFQFIGRIAGYRCRVCICAHRHRAFQSRCSVSPVLASLASQGRTCPHGLSCHHAGDWFPVFCGPRRACQVWSRLVSKLSYPVRANGGQLISESPAPRFGRAQGVTGCLQSPLRGPRFIRLVADVYHLLGPLLTCRPHYFCFTTNPFAGPAAGSPPQADRRIGCLFAASYKAVPSSDGKADVWNVGVYSRTACAAPASLPPVGAKTGRLALPAQRV